MARSLAEQAAEALLLCVLTAWALTSAYHIRLFAIRTYGAIIHEFDPWFNFRATQYLADHGVGAFFKWYDHESWYPLGRPVGTTIYPGMQLTAVALWKLLNNVAGVSISLNDVCVYMPAWFGTLATALLGLLTYEATGSARAGVLSAVVMSVIPAHIMRSVGGGFDNESVAISAMVLTFLLWIRSLRTHSSWPWGLACGAAYVYMVAAWGGFVFVINMIGVHAALLLALGRYTSNLHHAYSLWYVVGTLGAVQIPVVGWSPLKSFEQLGPGAVFAALQVFEAVEILSRRRRLEPAEKKKLLLRAFGTAGAVVVVLLALVVPSSYFGPLSVRVRSLFFEHTLTGNPLVDSVAEHQPSTPQMYWSYLHYCTYIAPVGLVILFFNRTDAKYFVILWAFIAYYFAQKMNRLMILMGPITSVLSGIALAAIFEYSLAQIAYYLDENKDKAQADTRVASGAAPASAPAASAPKKKEKKPRKDSFDAVIAEVVQFYQAPGTRIYRLVFALFLLYLVVANAPVFYWTAVRFAEGTSQPVLLYKARLQSGEEIMVEDYLHAYEWLKNSTPADARVLSWWDYGYQIAGVANRTTLADGNTWNLEHIALIGRMLTSSEAKAHSLAKHLADYILVWTGGGGDDLAKSPHMARIGSSVYPDICPDDPLCRHFGFYEQNKPTPSMANSLLYKLHSNGLVPGVSVDPTLFEEVHRSKYGLVRIYKILNIDESSKKWLADPANRICDAPGSWYCVGQYPPNFPKPPTTHRTISYENGRRH